jgi:hypothetical protein
MAQGGQQTVSKTIYSTKDALTKGVTKITGCSLHLNCRHPYAHKNDFNIGTLGVEVFTRKKDAEKVAARLVLEQFNEIIKESRRLKRLYLKLTAQSPERKHEKWGLCLRCHSGEKMSDWITVAYGTRPMKFPDEQAASKYEKQLINRGRWEPRPLPSPGPR